MRKSFSPQLALLFLLAATFSQSALGQAKVKLQKVYHPPEPFTAEFKTTRVQTLANGTTIARESTSTEARDAQGRYVSINTSTPNAEEAPQTNIHIDDHVAGTQTDIESRTKKAVVVKFPPEEQRHGCWFSEAGHLTMHYSGNEAPPSPSAAARMPKPVHEDLGDAEIQGIPVHGTRLTTVIPVGTIGNDQQLTHMRENWSAPQFSLTLRHVSDDPRMGREDKELVNFTRGEPDAALFQIPEGYAVVTDDMVPCKE